MSKIKEKDILKNIKEAVESETPEVWDKIKSSDKCKYDLEFQSPKPKYSPVRKYSLVAACFLFVFVALGTRILQLPKDLAAPQYDSGGRTVGFQEGGTRFPAMVSEDAKGGTPDIYRPFSKEVNAEEAAKAMNLQILTPTWLPQGFTQVNSILFSYDEKGSQPYMYSREYRNAAGKIITIDVTKNIKGDGKALPAPMPMPVDPGNGAVKTDGREPAIKPEVLPGKVDAGIAPDHKAVPPDYKEIPPTPPVVNGQTTPGYNPSAVVDKPSNAVDLPTAPREMTPPQSSGGNSGSNAVVSVQFVRTEINGVIVDMTVTSSKEPEVLNAHWVGTESFYNISTSGISKNDMIKILTSIIK